MASSSRIVARLVWGLLRAGVYVVLAAILLFVAFTRTEVGRDRLRRELETVFDDRFAGRLEIGSLQGTLLNDLYATDVRLHDENDRLVASIDSLAATPSWSHLFAAELSVESLTLIGPHLVLHRRADSSWNATHALRRRVPSSSSQSPLDLSLSHVEIRDGRVTTTRVGPAPALVDKRWLFDYTRSELSDLHLEGAVQWSDATRRVTVDALQFRLPGRNLSLQSAKATLNRQGGTWTVDPAALQLGNTTLQATATVEPPASDTGQTTLNLTLSDSRLDHDQLRTLVPRLPLRETVTIDGRVSGSLNRFVVNRLTVAHERSRLAVEGTAFGLPDSLDIDAQLQESYVRPSDVRAVWPNAPLDRFNKIGPLHLSASVEGQVQWKTRTRPAFDLESTLSARGAPGAVQGSIDVQRTSTAPLQYTGTAQFDSLNLAPITGTDRLDSRLTGRIRLDGTGTSFSTVDGQLRATLSSSRIGPRQVSFADLQLTARSKTVQGKLALQQPSGGTLSLNGTVDAQGPAPLYDLTATTESVNLSGLHPRLPTTRLNATLTADGQGTDWETVTGSLNLEFDQSSLHPDDDARTRILPPHTITASLSNPTAAPPRLDVGGTIGSATLTGPLLHPTLRSSIQRWRTAVQQAVRHELADANRSNNSPRSTPADTTSIVGSPRPTATPLHLKGELAVHRMDLLRQWWPGAPDDSDRLRATTRLTIGPDTLSAAGSLSAAHLRLGAQRLDSLSASYQLSGPHRRPLLASLVASVSARADTLHLGSRSLVAPSATLTLVNGSGALSAQADELGRTGPFRLVSDVRLDRGLHFHIADAYAETGQNAWTADPAGSVVVHAGAVAIDSLTFRSPRPLAATEQTVRLHGTLSPAPSDTLHAEMSDVLLYPVSELASLPKPLGGRMNGTVAVTGGWAQPQVRSTVTIDRLSFDRRVLGTLSLQTRLRPDTPDLRLNATLTSPPDSVEGLDGPPLVPNGPRMVEENRMDVRGRIRLPGLAPPSQNTDPLDLTVDVHRADLFFFEYIFEETLTNVRGYTEGTIHIGGRFRRPVFNAQMEVHEGDFTLPQFGLQYTASGPVTVDKTGIHLQSASVTDGEGTATVNGSLLFNDYRNFSFDLSAQLDELTIIDVDNAQDLAFYGTIRASGSASLTGPLQDATLRSRAARTTPESELYIPVSESGVNDDTGFIVFADSTGRIPDLRDLTRRSNILSDRPAGAPSFIEGLEIDINVIAPEESTVNLVFDPVVGDVVTAVGSGRVQLQRQEGEFFVYGDFTVSGGTYLFTAGEVFVRRFNINEGTITWDGPPINAQLDLKADYRTRASTAGLPGFDEEIRIPVRVNLDIGGRVESPQVDLSLAQVKDERNNLVGSQTLDAFLNQADRTTEYATSVLLTNTFLLTTESFTGPSGSDTGGESGNLNTAGRKLAFNSVSQLVASQLNRYLGAALPNVDLNFGVQGENPNDLDLIYGVALRLLNERLVIRGEGVYTGDNPDNQQTVQGPQGEFVVEVRLSRRVSVEAFYRRTGDDLTQNQTLTSSTGAGLSYQTEFSTWRELWERLFGWLFSDDDESPDPESPDAEPPPPTDPSDDPSDDPAAPPNEPVARGNGLPADTTAGTSPSTNE